MERIWGTDAENLLDKMVLERRLSWKESAFL